MTDIGDFHDFSAQLSHAIFDLKPGQNNFCSPLSIQLAISLLLLNNENAPHNLKWNEALYDQKPLKDIVLEIANTIYHDKTISIKSQVKNILGSLENAQIHGVDFRNDPKGQVKLINGHVEKQTKGLIKELVNDGVIHSGIASVLLNCIYFKGTWKKPFDKAFTKPYPWKGDESKKFSAMSQKSKLLSIRRGEPDGIECVSVPYTDEVSFIAIISRDGKNQPHLSNLKQYLKEMRPKRQMDVQLVMPKFKNEAQYDCTELLPKFDIPMVTNDLATEALAVDSVIHKAVIDLDEEGTEAAAATAVMMMRCAMIGRPEPPFVLDREFLYVIYDRPNDRILFSGSFVEPDFL